MSETPKFQGTGDKPQRLAELEKELVLNSFKERGAALAEINQGELYKPAFNSFEDYCQQRWKMTRSYAYRLIQASAVAREMLPIGNIATESQARALLKLPAETRATVFADALKRAEAEGRSLAAKDMEPGTVTTPASAVPITDSTIPQSPSQDQASIQDQLRELWTKAGEADRHCFLKWVATAPNVVAEEAGEEDRYRCNSCEETFEDDSDAVTLYECGDCGSIFSETSTGSNRCPDCNRFASVLTHSGCPHCEEGELEETEGI